MPTTFDANPNNIAELLEIIRDGHELSLASGEYRGPFIINKKIALKGVGENTIIFAADEPAVIVAVPGVRLSNLVVERTVGGDAGAVAVAAAPGMEPVLDRVRCLGAAPNVRWERLSWNIPAAINFGEIQALRQVQRTEQLQLGESCQISCSHPWLQVQPIYLSPGLQKLDIFLNSKDIPAGTNLSGSIFLAADSRQLQIEISATIIGEAIAELPLVETQPLAENNSLICGYRLLGSAVDSLIRNIEGQNTLDQYTDFSLRRNRAEELLSEIFGYLPRLFYVRRQGAGENSGEEKWELTIATDIEAAELPVFLKEREKTLNLLAIVTEGGAGGLRLLSAKLVPQARGRRDGFSVLFSLNLRLNYQFQIGVPPSVLNRMKTVPFCGDCVPTEEQLKTWKAFLNIEERIAKTREFCVPFFGHNYGSATRKITLEINASKAVLDKSSEIFLKPEDFWKRVAKARNEELKLLTFQIEDSPNKDDSTSGKASAKVSLEKWTAILLGSLEEVDREKSFIRVRLDSELVEKITEGRYQLPANGFLSFEAAGDLTQIKRQKKALEDVHRGSAQNPYIGEFFFDASKARTPQVTVKLRPEDLLLPTANPDQIAAVEAVLSAPDLVLIQGPPGTGKTTVIAEICYQVALRGGRTLISSQANLAVDNALSRLVDSPIIRPLRKGRAERVEEEGLPFLEDKVIGTWLRSTADDCEKKLAKQRKNIYFYRQILETYKRFNGYLIEEKNLEESQKEWRDRQRDIESSCRTKQSAYESIKAEQREIEEYLLPSLKSLISAPRDNWEDSNTINLLTTVINYCEKWPELVFFKVSVQKTVKLAIELGIEVPESNLFSLAAWLKSRGIELLEMPLSCLQDTLAAIEEAELAALNFNDKLQVVELLKTQYQPIISEQETIQQAINNWSNRKFQIEKLGAEIESWKSTALSSVYVSLKQCVESGGIFPDELIQLPQGVLSFVKVNPVPWRPSLDRCRSKIANLITKGSAAKKVSPIESELSGVAKETISGIAASTKNWLHQQQGLEKPQIQLILRAIETWQSTVYNMVYEELKICVRSNGRFTDNLIQLPPELLAIAPALSQPWRPNLDRCRSKIANLIAQQSQRETFNFDAELNQIATETTAGIANRVSQWLEQQQPETENQLQQLNKQLTEHQLRTANQQQEIKAAQKQLEILQGEADAKSKKSPQLLAKFSSLSAIPNELRRLAIQFTSISVAVANKPIAEFSQQVKLWEQQIARLEELLDSLNPLRELQRIKKSLATLLSDLRNTADKSLKELQESQSQLREISVRLQRLQQQQLPETLIAERKWWESAWQAIPNELKPPVPSNGLFDLNFLRDLKAQFDAWHRELEREESHLKHYENLMQNWIAKLRNPSEQDRNELRQIYIDNANAIGITCSQVASYDFKEFNNFDVVIIDEVSKCTPPEMLIPALKGKKIVLIGDYRQLPPMLHENSLEEIATEIGSEPEDISFLEESLFKKQFESAPESMKRRLTIQYRMHPYIMGAINQFYDHSLHCGIIQPELQRAHNLAGEIIKENHHLIWVKMPQEQRFEEEVEGTSKFNIKEVDTIDILCQQMSDTWSLKIANGSLKKEIGIITFYGAQLRRIEDMLGNRKFPSLSIRTGTVDRFQGMERPVIIVSMVRNNSSGDIGFAKKPERVNVAFSRAQELLIVVGCHSLFTKHKGKVGFMYSEVSKIVHGNGGMIDVSSVLS